MIIDSKKYNGKCICGKAHTMTTELCVIEEGALGDISKYISECGLSGFSVAVYDENTYEAEGIVRPECDLEIILPKLNLHADERGVKLLLDRLPEECDYMIAVGSGTVHDITRYCAYEKKIPFVSCPTAASVDGFCSSVAAMTWHGYKKTFTAVAPKIVVADLNVISRAPTYLTKSGFGDMIGKYISLFEWKLGREVLEEDFCERIYEMTLEATNAVMESAEGIKKGETKAFEKLIYGLLVSGLAMQLLGTSRCASGAEHHISHLIEMQPEALSVKSDALHGEKVGVGTLIAAREYHRLAGMDFKICDYPRIEDGYVFKMFGARLCESIISENKDDVAKGLTASEIKTKLINIKRLVKDIPTPERLICVYRLLNLKEKLTDINVPEEKLGEILEYSPLVRNRLTLMRLRRAFDI